MRKLLVLLGLLLMNSSPAQSQGLSVTTVQEFLEQHKVQPHHAGMNLKSFKALGLDALVTVWEKRGPRPGMIESLVEVFQIRKRNDPVSPYDFLFNDKKQFERAVSIASPDVSDLNGDKKTDIALEIYTGGNCWSCEELELLELNPDDGTLRTVSLPQEEYLSAKDFADLDKDGVYELVMLDTRWENGFDGALCHACAPAVEVIMAWKNGRWQRASAQFPQFYQDKISELEAELSKEPFDAAYYLGDVISMFLNYVEKGDLQAGMANLKKYLQAKRLEEPDAPDVRTIIEQLSKVYK